MNRKSPRRLRNERYAENTVVWSVGGLLGLLMLILMIALCAAPWVLVLFVAHWLGAF